MVRCGCCRCTTTPASSTTPTELPTPGPGPPSPLTQPTSTYLPRHQEVSIRRPHPLLTRSERSGGEGDVVSSSPRRQHTTAPVLPGAGCSSLGLVTRGLPRTGLLCAWWVHDFRSGRSELGNRGRCTMRRSLRLDDARAQVPTRPRPWCERRGEGVGEAVGRTLVVDSPTSKVRPRLFGAALNRKPDEDELVDSARELLIRQQNRCVRIGVVINRVPQGARETVEESEAHPQTEARLTRGGRRTERQLHRTGVEDRQETDDPVEPRLGRTKEQQHRIRHVALGHLGGPLLPVGVELGQRVIDTDELMASE